MLEANTKTILQENGIKPTFQRVKIYEYLLDNKEHPSIDKIFHDLENEIPTLSKTTIYNTVKLFNHKNIIHFLLIDENELRVDPEIKKHGHFKCLKCGVIYDLDIDTNSILENIDKQLEIKEFHTYFKGYCPRCKTLKKEE